MNGYLTILFLRFLIQLVSCVMDLMLLVFVFMFPCKQFQIHSESEAPDQATQWGDWVWSLENEEEEALGDGFVYLWLPNKCLCSSGLNLILLSVCNVSNIFSNQNV